MISLECHNVFALVCRSNHEFKERLYAFALISKEVENSGDEKLKLLHVLCRHLANAVCRTDAVRFVFQDTVILFNSWKMLH